VSHDVGDDVRRTTARLGEFVSQGQPGAKARHVAVGAFLDTVGVTLAGASEAVARIVQRVVAAESSGSCRIFGTSIRTSASGAALVNGTAAHALDFDDMCFVSLAHPSAPLVAAALATGELAGAHGRSVLDAYVVAFEIEGRLGRAMNPRHYERGWHATSTLGTVGAAATAARVLGLDPEAAARALAIAASEASGLKQNFGTMVKPLHAGLAARNGVLAALLAKEGMTASDLAFDGPQGFLVAMDSRQPSLEEATVDLGTHWEILDTGVTIKLYPSCAGTHPTIDALLDLRRQERLTAADVEGIEIRVDSVTPDVLIYDRPTTGLEAKFSMPFCAAAAIIDGRIDVETFEADRLRDSAIAALLPRVRMCVDPALGRDAPPLTQARLQIQLKDGRVLTAAADGARGYPERPATRDEMLAKFRACARRALTEQKAEQALGALLDIESASDVRTITNVLSLG
jgi:2-methylcitrate dehydratase PrpD